MKKRHIIFYGFILFCLVISSVSCSTLQKTSQNPSPECLGVWINAQYNAEEKTAAKIVYYPDMTWDAYEYDFSMKPRWRGTISIIDTWKDNEGCCWYKVTTNQLGLNFVVYELWRIGEAGKVLEGMWSIGIMPDYIDQSSDSYSIYYRLDDQAREIRPKTLQNVI
jgi:hypothetical protein